MKNKAAVLWGVGEDWSVEEVELDGPREGEVLVRLAASGLCHSDEHLLTGDLPVPGFPYIGGHEGAGEVVEVGPGVQGLAPGDHVVLGFIPSCGKCPSCASGHQNLCDYGALILEGHQLSDGTSRHRARGQDARLMCVLGTFEPYTVVHQFSCIKIDDDVPLDKAALVGCGVTTGLGSAIYAADVHPGDTVVVVGIGGIGINAVQGARLAGAEQIVAVDPVAFKRTEAERFGATHTAASMEEALPLVQEITRGAMARSVILTIGVVKGEHVAPALALTAKTGTCVVTGLSAATDITATVSLLDLTLYEKHLRGSLFGSSNPRYEIPRVLSQYMKGHIDLDSLITREYKLEDINQGYQDMRDGVNLRGLIRY
jgi:S-(hydroxymethyl)glutathione dehydrogenase / alcohol dehydrogenase